MDYSINIDFSSFVKENTKYNLVINNKKSTQDFIYLRSSISSSKEASKFVKDFEIFSSTSWIVDKIRKPKKLLFSKTWACQQSSRRKKYLSERNSNCGARILIIIKKINESTKHLDEYIRLPLPLPAEIRIHLKHSHQIDNVFSLRILRVSDEVQEKYFQYFNSGLMPTAAKRFHENNILLRDLANSSKNPTIRQVCHLHKKWQEMIGFTCYPYQKPLEKCKFDKETGRPAKTEDVDHPDWVPSINMGYPTKAARLTDSPYVEYLRNSIVKENEPEKTILCQQQSSVNTFQDNSSDFSDKWNCIDSDGSSSDTVIKDSVSSEVNESDEEVSGENVADERVLFEKT